METRQIPITISNRLLCVIEVVHKRRVTLDECLSLQETNTHSIYNNRADPIFGPNRLQFQRPTATYERRPCSYHIRFTCRSSDFLIFAKTGFMVGAGLLTAPACHCNLLATMASILHCYTIRGREVGREGRKGGREGGRGVVH